ncbi:late nodulin [Medicago truncatula]|uniref:Late nodulin n=1 Tax=Medicago truncatula TaxID=3880 RepID=A0A072V9L8_MEDTR|nr:late nodulin [Medicago truncatula]
MQRRKHMDQITHLLYAFIIFLYVNFASTESDYQDLVPCLSRADCPQDMSCNKRQQRTEPTLLDWNTEKQLFFQETLEWGLFEILLCIYIEAWKVGINAPL